MALHWWVSLGPDVTWPGATYRMSHGQEPLTGCHWPGNRAVLAKEYIYYIVKKTWHSPCGAYL